MLVAFRLTIRSEMYVDRDEAIANGVNPAHIIPANKLREFVIKCVDSDTYLPKLASILRGYYVELSDGVIDKVSVVTTNSHDKYGRLEVKTQSGFRFMAVVGVGGDVRTKCSALSRGLSWAGPGATDPGNPNYYRIKFVEQWLLKGYSIERALSANWRSVAGLESELGKLGIENYKISTQRLRAVAAILLSKPWFDKLLAMREDIRVKYMGLLDKLKQAGINEELVANYAKSVLSGEGDYTASERLNVFNKLVELYHEEEAVRAKRDERAHLAKLLEEADAIPTVTKAVIHARPLPPEGRLPITNEGGDNRVYAPVQIEDIQSAD